MLELFKELLKGVRKAAVVTHKRADADALACAHVVKLVLEKLGVESGPVVCPEGPPLGGCVEDVPNDVDVYVLVDVASLAQVPPLRGRLIKIDHHAAGDEVPGVWDNRPSCTEVALQLAEEAGVEIPPEVARLAVLGIYTDSGRLKRADAKTLQYLSKLLGVLGVALGEVVAEDGRRAEHEVIALLKGLKRVAIYRSSVGLICASHVGAYESEVASLLVALGCRIALVASRKKDGVHISMRSREYDVSTLAKRLGGGGHKEAAVAIIGEKITKDKLHRLLWEIVREIDPDARPVA